ncbi:MAG: carboxypeptidase-like regulatory domain-containing protein, partial [Planctomycetota bacterium]
GSVPDDKFDSDENGNFRIKAIAGRAVVAAVAKDRDQRTKYLPNRDDELFARIGGQEMRKVFNGWSADYFDALVEVDFAADEDELTQDLVFKRGRRRTLQVTDDEGRPVSEIQAIGRTFPPVRRLETLEDSRLEVVGLQSTESRMVVLMDEPRALGQVINVSGAESDPMSVRLSPCATVTGRVVDEDGVGVDNLAIRAAPIPEPQTDNWSRELTESVTNADGEFSVPLPSGSAWRVFAYSDVGPSFSANIRPHPGASYDLGDLRHDDELEESDTQQKAAVKAADGATSSTAVDASAARTEPTRIRGRVVNADGNGVAAKVHVVDKLSGNVTKPGREQILRSVESDSEGRFDFSMALPPRNDAIDRGVWNASVLQLVATASGYGPAVSDMIDVRKGKPVELRLAADDIVIEGKILTLEGEPVAGATLRVAILDCRSDVGKHVEALRRQMEREKPGQMRLSYWRVDDFLAPGYDLDANERIVASKLHHSQFASQPVSTDANGTFRLGGVGRDRMLALELSGPGIVKTWISVISRDMEPINAPIFIGGRTRMTYGAKFTYSAEPSQPIIGAIADVETGEPIEGVRVELAEGTSSVHAVGVTDAKGAYRLDGAPKGKRYALNLIPPPD